MASVPVQVNTWVSADQMTEQVGIGLTRTSSKKSSHNLSVQINKNTTTTTTTTIPTIIPPSPKRQSVQSTLAALVDKKNSVSVFINTPTPKPEDLHNPTNKPKVINTDYFLRKSGEYLEGADKRKCELSIQTHKGLDVIARAKSLPPVAYYKRITLKLQYILTTTCIAVAITLIPLAPVHYNIGHIFYFILLSSVLISYSYMFAKTLFKIPMPYAIPLFLLSLTIVALPYGIYGQHAYPVLFLACMPGLVAWHFLFPFACERQLWFDKRFWLQMLRYLFMVGVAYSVIMVLLAYRFLYINCQDDFQAFLGFALPVLEVFYKKACIFVITKKLGYSQYSHLTIMPMVQACAYFWMSLLLPEINSTEGLASLVAGQAVVFLYYIICFTDYYFKKFIEGTKDYLHKDEDTHGVSLLREMHHSYVLLEYIKRSLAHISSSFTALIMSLFLRYGWNAPYSQVARLSDTKFDSIITFYIIYTCAVVFGLVVVHTWCCSEFMAKNMKHSKDVVESTVRQVLYADRIPLIAGAASMALVLYGLQLYPNGMMFFVEYTAESDPLIN